MQVMAMLLYVCPLGMLRREGPKEWIVDEVQSIAEMNFRSHRHMTSVHCLPFLPSCPD